MPKIILDAQTTAFFQYILHGFGTWLLKPDVAKMLRTGNLQNWVSSLTIANQLGGLGDRGTPTIQHELETKIAQWMTQYPEYLETKRAYDMTWYRAKGRAQYGYASPLPMRDPKPGSFQV